MAVADPPMPRVELDVEAGRNALASVGLTQANPAACAPRARPSVISGAEKSNASSITCDSCAVPRVCPRAGSPLPRSGDSSASCPIRRPAKPTTSRSAAICGTRRRPCSSPANRSASSAIRSISSRISASRTRPFEQLKVVLRPGRKHKFRFEYTPISWTQEARLNRDHRLQRPALQRVAAGPRRAQVERDAVRLRVGFRLPRPRIRRPGARSEVHRRRSGAGERPRSGASSSAPRRRFRRSASSAAAMSLPNVSITGEFTRLQAAGEHRRGLPGTLLRLRPVRHGQLHRQFRRPGRLPLAVTVFYKVETDQGDFKMKGLYFGAGARFARFR